MDWSVYDDDMDTIARNTCASGWIITGEERKGSFRAVGIYTGSLSLIELNPPPSSAEEITGHLLWVE